MRNWLYILIALSLGSCENYFGSKTNLDFIDKPVFQNRNIAYVPILPVIDGFVRPTDIVAGFDELVYVVDEGTEEIVAFDLSGSEVGRLAVPGLTALAQDRKLDLLAIGRIDTFLNGQNRSFSTIFRINQRANGFLDLSNATIEPRVIHPFYAQSQFSDDDEITEFTSIAVLADNSYYVARNGPDEDDDAVLVFGSESYGTILGLDIEDDEYLSPVFVTTSTGFETNYFRDPVSLASLVQPPQNFNLSTSRDFVFSSINDDATLKVQYIEFIETIDGATYEVRPLEEGDTSKAEGFLYTPNRFTSPVDVAYTGDGTNYIFVVDSETDSLYQFSNTGLEGIKPPAASADQKYIRASFGGTDETGLDVSGFNEPSGVAYSDKIVYVADAANGRILRFKLTLDFD